MNELVTIILGYCLVFFLSFFFFNFLSNGFLLTFIRVKGSRGRLVMVILKGLSNTAFKTGKFDKNKLSFKSARKKTKTILIDKTCVERLMGVVAISVDDITDTALSPDLKGVEAVNGEQYDDLLVTAQGLPRISKDKEKMIMLIIGIATLVVLLFVVYRINVLNVAVTSLQSQGVIV
jgi:hypothetical protein